MEEMNAVLSEYERHFGERLIYAEDLPMPPPEQWLKELQHCIDADTPYVYPTSDLPNDCLP